MYRIVQALIATLALFTASAHAQWPVKPVKIIVPAGAGGGTADPISRILAEELTKAMGQRVYTENMAGANGNIGAAAATKAEADGYTLLFSWAGTLATNPSLYKNLPYNARAQMQPIVRIGTVPNILVVNPAFPAQNFAEFNAHVKANPGRLNYGSSGNGSSMHLAAELYKQQTKTFMLHIPYNAVARAVTDLMGGEIQLMFNLVPGVSSQVKGGKLRALAILSDKRSEALPDVPTVSELGMKNLISGTWFGLLAPKGTPPEVTARVNSEVLKILANPEVRTRLIGMGLEIQPPQGNTPEGFATFWDEEIRRWAEVVKFSGAKID